MDYLGFLREKIARLREEIAVIQELNQQFRGDGGNGIGAQVTHGQRGARLQEIQHELGKLARLGSGVILPEQTKLPDHSPTLLVKRRRAA
jgi:hypothetical protein